MNYFIFILNPNKYDLEGALQEFNNQFDITLNRNMSLVEDGDIVFIYKTAPFQCLCYKAEVVNSYVKFKDSFNDFKYLKGELDNSQALRQSNDEKRFARLKIISKLEDNKYSKELLEANGIQLRGSSRIIKGKNFISSIN